MAPIDYVFGKFGSAESEALGWVACRFRQPGEGSHSINIDWTARQGLTGDEDAADHPVPPSFCQPAPKHSEVFASAGFEMAISSSLLIYGFLLCLLIQGSMSVPATAFRPDHNVTTNDLSLHPFLSSLSIFPLLNLTSSLSNLGVRYRVPNTYVLKSDSFL